MQTIQIKKKQIKKEKEKDKMSNKSGTVYILGSAKVWGSRYIMLNGRTGALLNYIEKSG